MRAAEVVEVARLAIMGAVGAVRGTYAVEGRQLKSRPRYCYDRKGHRVALEATGVTIHESVIERVAGRGVEPSTVLAKKGLGVHYTVHRPEDEATDATDVVVESHAPIDRAVAHGGRWHNRRDVAIEIENRYRPAAGDEAVAGTVEGVRDVIEARWAWKRRSWARRLYVLPAAAQLEATHVLLEILADQLGRELWYPAADGPKGFRWGRDERHVRRADGRLAVCAHYRWAHADGLVPECYSWLRSLGYPPADAYTHTVKLASAGQRWTKAQEL